MTAFLMFVFEQRLTIEIVMTLTWHNDYDSMKPHIDIAQAEKSRPMVKYSRKKK